MSTERRPLVLINGRRSEMPSGDLVPSNTLPIDTDPDMTADSDILIPSQKAVKSYIDVYSPRGLYSGRLSKDIPTQSNTGFSTWVNQGTATVSDTGAGMTIYAPSGSSDSLNMLVKSVPSSHYTITALVALTCKTASYPGFAFGWRDSSTGKCHVFYIQKNSTYTQPITGQINEFSSPTSSNSNYYFLAHSPIWLRISDDGTNIAFSFSSDGEHFVTWRSIAKSSGYLGSSGYNQVCFGGDSWNSEVYATLISYQEG